MVDNKMEECIDRQHEEGIQILAEAETLENKEYEN